MAKASATTGLGTTSGVAVEQYFPPSRRIIDDPLARSILPGAMRAFVYLMRPAFARDWLVRTGERATPGVWGGVMCRKRYIDDSLVASIGQIDAVVNLGAGFDTRVYRLPALAAVPVWEVDQPQNIEPKRARLRTLFGEVPSHVTLVPIDFDSQDLGAVLAAHGYAQRLRTFFIAEAVTQYLTDHGVRKTFDFLAGSAQSRLVFTYVRWDFIHGRVRYGQERLYQRYVVPGTWRFGLDPVQVQDFLAPYGWRVVEHLGARELAERYVKPTGRQLTTTEIERIVSAEHP